VDKYRSSHILDTNLPDIIFCDECEGKGQMNDGRNYRWEQPVDPIVCKICRGYGYTEVTNGQEVEGPGI
jgi:DnaJ-class molecular chaperone